jgi:hypothetical protein
VAVTAAAAAAAAAVSVVVLLIVSCKSRGVVVELLNYALREEKVKRKLRIISGHDINYWPRAGQSAQPLQLTDQRRDYEGVARYADY